MLILSIFQRLQLAVKQYFGLVSCLFFLKNFYCLWIYFVYFVFYKSYYSLPVFILSVSESTEQGGPEAAEAPACKRQKLYEEQSTAC